MDDLRRELAPITEGAWEEIEEQAQATLTTHLAVRKLVDVDGPHGWDRSAVNVGRTEDLEESPAGGVEARRRQVQPLVELRATFELDRRELDDVSRGSEDPDLAPLVTAATNLARAEDRLVFYGHEAAGVRGLCPFCEHVPLESKEGFADYPRLVSEAINVLRQSGVGGPYALVLGPTAYTGIAETAESGGYPVIEHVHQLMEGPIVWAPVLEGGLVLSLRGGDFVLTLGRDVSVGYRDHDGDTVRLYLEESLTFRTLAPEAAVSLRPVEGGDAEG